MRLSTVSWNCKFPVVEALSDLILLNAYPWDNSVQIVELGGKEVKVYSGNGKLYNLTEVFMERAMRNKSGKRGWDKVLEKTVCARLKTLGFVW